MMSHFDEASEARDFARAFREASDISGFIKAFREASDISGFGEGFWWALNLRGTTDAFVFGYKEAARNSSALLRRAKGWMPVTRIGLLPPFMHRVRIREYPAQGRVGYAPMHRRRGWFHKHGTNIVPFFGHAFFDVFFDVKDLTNFRKDITKIRDHIDHINTEMSTIYYACTVTRTVFIILDCYEPYSHELASQLMRHPWVSEVWFIPDRSHLLIKISVPEDFARISQLLLDLKGTLGVKHASAMITSSVHREG